MAPVAWHGDGREREEDISRYRGGNRPLDIFVFEGTVIRGPDGTGRFNMFADRPMKYWVTEISARAAVVVAMGGCACWGGIPATAPNAVDPLGSCLGLRQMVA